MTLIIHCFDAVVTVWGQHLCALARFINTVSIIIFFLELFLFAFIFFKIMQVEFLKNKLWKRTN